MLYQLSYGPPILGNLAPSSRGMQEYRRRSDACRTRISRLVSMTARPAEMLERVRIIIPCPDCVTQLDPTDQPSMMR